MARRLLCFSFLAFFVLTLAGCATGRKNKELEIQGLRNQVSALEAQLQAKDEELGSLKTSREQSMQKKQASKKVPEVKERPNAKQIQVALKNAGYYSGIIDGKIGRQSREAIKTFQGDNNLQVDGKVGKKTWALLRGYLAKKVK